VTVQRSFWLRTKARLKNRAFIPPDDGRKIVIWEVSRTIEVCWLSIDIWTITGVKAALNSLELSDVGHGLFARDAPHTSRIFCVGKTVAIIIDSIVTYFRLPLAWCARLYPLHALA